VGEDGITFNIEGIKKFYDMTFLRDQIKILGKETFASVVQKWLENTVIEYLNLIYEKTNLGFIRTPRNRQYKFSSIEYSIHYLDASTGNFVVGDLHNLLDLYQKESEVITI
jgi:hypothetical protein